MVAHIAFVGLGAMGRPIARHLAAKRDSGSQTITALDADPARLAGLDAPGLVATTDPDKIAGAQVLFLCLPDGDAVEAVLFGVGGLAARLAPGAVVVDLSTTAHAKAVATGEALDKSQKGFVDAPVSGAPAGAEAGTLTVMCGGAAQTVAAVRPLLARFGAHVLHMGPVGSGQLAKTLNNVLYDIAIAALAEVLPMAVAMGLDPAQVAQVVTTGTSRSYAAQTFVPQILADRFDVGYPMGAAYKDLVAAAAVSAGRGFPMPVGRPNSRSTARLRVPPSPAEGGGRRACRIGGGLIADARGRKTIPKNLTPPARSARGSARRSPPPAG